MALTVAHADVSHTHTHTHSLSLTAFQTAWVKGHVVLLQLLHRSASASAVELAAIATLLASTWPPAAASSSSVPSALGMSVTLAVPLAQGLATLRAAAVPAAPEGDQDKLDDAELVQALAAVRPAFQGTQHTHRPRSGERMAHIHPHAWP
jgi:hypothetical protein